MFAFFKKFLAIVMIHAVAFDANTDGAGAAAPKVLPPAAPKVLPPAAPKVLPPAAPKVLPTVGPNGLNITVYAIPYNTTEKADLHEDKTKLRDMWNLLNRTILQLQKFEENNKEILMNATYEDGLHHPRIHEVVKGTGGGANKALAVANDALARRQGHGCGGFLAMFSIAAAAANAAGLLG